MEEAQACHNIVPIIFVIFFSIAAALTHKVCLKIICKYHIDFKNYDFFSFDLNKNHKM